jgi:hypothetical protein
LYLDQAELDRLINEALRRYYNFLAVEYILGYRGKEFWKYHSERLAELGHPLSRMLLLRAAMTHLGRELLNPVRAIKKLAKRLPKSERRPLTQAASRG